MKNILAFLLLWVVAGCSSYEAEQLRSFASDPHYVRYQENLDTLEKSYLNKEIPYSVYLEKKKLLDDMYDKEVRYREEEMHR